MNGFTPEQLEKCDKAYTEWYEAFGRRLPGDHRAIRIAFNSGYMVREHERQKLTLAEAEAITRRSL